jgi:hypothetical protein
LEEQVKRLKFEKDYLEFFKSEALSFNSNLKDVKENFYRKLSETQQYHHDLLKLFDRVETQLEENMAAQVSFVKIRGWEKKNAEAPKGILMEGFEGHKF